MKATSFRKDVLPLKDMLYRLALRITVSREEAEDVVQDTLLKVWARRDSWQEIDSIEAFSAAVCRNLALDRVKRKDAQNIPLSAMPGENADAAYTPYESASHSDKVEIVKRLIDSLPEKQRTCLQLRDIEGKSYKEVAAVMGVSEDVVKVSIFRARQTVKKKFQKIEDYGL